MKVVSTPLPQLQLIETDTASDSRGRLERVFCAEQWHQVFGARRICQINLSSTARRGTLRGMHYQRPPVADAKLIRCVRGAIFDVAIDLRAGSSTFLQWHAVELCEDIPRQLFIPEGFAHGFQALSDDVQVLYFHSAPWSPAHEGGVRFDDERVGIEWPLQPTAISERDKTHPLLDRFEGVVT